MRSREMIGHKGHRETQRDTEMKLDYLFFVISVSSVAD
jgi:hypothetical protein